ncbi:flagellar hook-basal body complex protein [Maricaulis sp.]|uniref:flagellar hook-basal body complex protein n=1 Tax=Maricaulis sp. TaxID=1486257 RepID=UPI003A90A92A
MDNALMIGLSRQMALRQAMDVVANNIANANTAGFKVESLLVENIAAPTAEQADGPTDLQYVDVWGMGRDFRQGALQATGRTFDVAIEGEGFFAVEVNGAEQYSRDGRFHLDNNGQLAAHDGAPVLDAASRSPIMLNPSATSTTITEGGAIMQDGVEVARLGVFEVANLAGLSKQGSGRYVQTDNADGRNTPEAAFAPTVRQGFVEASNVQPVVEMTDMMTVMRSYQSVSKFIEQTEDINRRAIERLGKV